MELHNGIENGLAQLFKNGIIQLSWRMKNGIRDGFLTIFENGVVSRMIAWDSIQAISESRDNATIREIVNEENGVCFLVEKVVSNGIIVYRGQYNPDNMLKQGWGTEFDKETGDEKIYGYYRDDELVHIKMSFENEEGKGKMMIEYGGDENDDNAREVLNRHPIYTGCYTYNPRDNVFSRSGRGFFINAYSGFCERVFESNVIDKNLYRGWYGKVQGDPSIRMNDYSKDMQQKHEQNIAPMREEGERNGIIVSYQNGVKMSISESIRNCVIPTNNLNWKYGDISGMSLTVINNTNLEQIVIENGCFQFVRTFIIENVPNLYSVKIGSSCCTRGNQECMDGVFRIANCPNLLQLGIGSDSFSDYSQFELVNVNSLQTISFGGNCFRYAEECSLKGE